MFEVGKEIAEAGVEIEEEGMKSMGQRVVARLRWRREGDAGVGRRVDKVDSAAVGRQEGVEMEVAADRRKGNALAGGTLNVRY